MSEPTPDQLKAAIERLETEKQSRLEQKIEAGEILRVKLAVVGEAIPDADAVEQAKVRKTEELRTAGEHRPIHWDVTCISTGVPRSENYGRWTPGQPLPEVESSVADETINRRRTEPVQIRTTVRPASTDGTDPGEIASGSFVIEGSTVIVSDAKGKHIGSRLLKAGDDPAVAAKRLLREQHSAFWDPIKPPKLSIA